MSTTLVALLANYPTTPMPFPLPTNFSFGVCGVDPTLMPGCSVAVRLAAKINVRCSTAAGCTPSCATSPLFQDVLARYADRFGDTHASASAAAHPPPPLPPPPPQQDGGGEFWWRLNNTNCDQHDTCKSSCASSLAIDECQKVCEADPSCGGFLYYSKTHSFALKNASCWDDVGPLPSSDAGDDLFVRRPTPQPAPLPPGVSPLLSEVEVCVASASEALGQESIA
jgi:hypothetical protein